MTHLDARAYLDHLRSHGARIAAPPPSVILALHPAAASSRRRGRRQPAAPFARVDIDSSGVTAVTPAGPGAAVAAVTVDLLGALGVERIIAVGVAGAIGDRHRLLERVVVGDAIGADDIVGAYGGSTCAPQPELLARTLDTVTATAHTTNTPFRYRRDDPSKNANRGPTAAGVPTIVEMEAAALFTSAEANNIACDLAVVVSDARLDDRWIAAKPADVDSAVQSLATSVARSLVSEVT